MHVTCRDSLSKTILQGTLEGGRRRGRQRKCWMDNIKVNNYAHRLILSFCLPSVRTRSLGQRSFSLAVPSVWNTLPYEIKSSNTLSSFRLPLKTYLSQQPY